MPRSNGRTQLAVLLLAFLWFSAPWVASAASSVASARWQARPGTVKVYARKKVESQASAPVPTDALRQLDAEIIDDQETFLLFQLPLPNASAAPTILRDVADVVEVLDDFDILSFRAFPVDAREPQPYYLPGWARSIALPAPLRDAFVIQFATVPRNSWLEELRSAGASILDYVPHNGYIVLAEERALRAEAEHMPVQLLRLHQPIHKVSEQVRLALGPFIDVTVSIADVPEAVDAVALLDSMTLVPIRPPEFAGDRTLHRVTIDSSLVGQLAALPAVLWVDVYSPPEPSGQREVHLTLGDTLVTTSGTLSPILGNHRQWIIDKNLSAYKTAVRLAILDTGFDKGSLSSTPSTDVHPDFANSSGQSFVEVRNYTRMPTDSDADCYGHGTFVAGVLTGNAGGPPPTTQSKDEGNFYMGLGILPESPLLVGRVFNYLTSNSGAAGYDGQDLWVIYGDLTQRGVGITSNSFNHPTDTAYSEDARLYDRLVRASNGSNNGLPMAIYISAGNDESGSPTCSGAPVPPGRVTSPATAKNVITVGGSENVNGSSYQDNLGSTGAACANNGNEIWARSRVGPTSLDGRIKPDLVAPASGIEAPRTRDANFGTAGCRLSPMGTVIDGGSPSGQQHLWSRGTSFSAPLAAGAGALLYTWFKNVNSGEIPKPSLLKAMQVTLARDLTQTGRPPDTKQGWGKADLTRAFATDGRYVWNNEYSNTLMTQVGQIVTLPTSPGSGYRIKDTTKPVKITVAWTDASGDPTVNVALVNNLDLTVRIGGGRFAIGNDFDVSTGHSNIRVPGGTTGAYDSRNNLEQAFFTMAEAGSDHFRVEVFARSLAGDGINAWVAVANQQNFALFIENAELYQNNASVQSFTPPPSSVQGGAQLTSFVTMQNTGNSSWREGPSNFYRLASVSAGNAFGSRLYLSAGEVVTPFQTRTFSIAATAPYAWGVYPFRWQMIDEGIDLFGTATQPMNVTVNPVGRSFFTVTPCRIFDTRDATGEYGGPQLAASMARQFTVWNRCGIPSTATAVAINLTVIGPTGAGYLVVYPPNIPTPGTATLNYKSSVTRSNNAVVTLDNSGKIEVFTGVGATHAAMDVTGYFQ